MALHVLRGIIHDIGVSALLVGLVSGSVALQGCSNGRPAPEARKELPQRLDEIEIKIKDILLKVEVALTEAEQAKGLMYRDSMPADHGMLFVYSKPKKVSYYMLNCRFPLAIAFITGDGHIRQIKHMEPREAMPTRSKVVVKYVLEMNEGWFQKNKVAVGDVVKIIIP